MEVISKAKLAKEASRLWQRVSTEQKDHALMAMADELIQNQGDILAANTKDIIAAKERGITGALLDRLKLTPERIDDMAQGLNAVALFSDPIGEVISGHVRPNGMRIGQVRVPLGVIAMIYEARPNVTVDATGLCLKAGDAVILRGGSEAINSNLVIANCLRNTLKKLNLPYDVIQIIEDCDRSKINEMLHLNQYIDVVIPRGGKGLIQFVMEHSTIPVIQTGVGNCHIFVDESVKQELATQIIDNAKTQRPGVCNAVETVLVHKEIASEFLPKLYTVLSAKGVCIRGCELTKKVLPQIMLASESDWETEYLDFILAVKVVSNLDDAITHIEQFGTKHSEAILTESYSNAQEFLRLVDAAAVYVNASTRFTDGSQFGLGAEIGISTQKLHARGPMGLKELTTTKFIVYGNGNIRS